jgi:regulator of sigma E protease
MILDQIHSAWTYLVSINWWAIALGVLFFGASILVHELGHFWAARRRGMRVERFSIGFGPKIFAWRGQDGVEYRLSWFPLGGYVLLPQLAEMPAIEGESSIPVDTLPPISYATKMIVSVAGATMNVVFAFALACIVWVIGQPTSSEMASTRIGYVSPTLELGDGTKVPSPASLAGLQVGDIVRAVDGKPVEDWADFKQTLVTSAGRTAEGQPQAVFTIEREGRTQEITLHPILAGDEQFRSVGIAPGYELLVHDIVAGSVGQQAGFLAGDEILTLDGHRMLNIVAYQDYLVAHHDRSVTAHIKRGDRQLDVAIPARSNAVTTPRLGLNLTTGFRLTHPSPLAQIWEQVAMTFRTLWSLLNPRSDIGLSKATGPVGIARIFYSAAEAGIRPVLMFTILLNVSLAIFNLLPFPVLDGGHMLFATIGRIRGRPLPINFVMTAQSVFMVLLLTMVVYVTVFDVRRWSREPSPERPPATAPAK